jgi:flagellar biosynthesis GTPase FlhF
MFNFLFKKKEKPSIQSEILSDFEHAKKSIKIAVSWFTDDVLLDVLIRRAKSKIDIQVILSADEWNVIEYEKVQEIQKYGGIVHKIGAKDVDSATPDNLFMHAKFYIIDGNLAKSGSYNFSKNAAVKQFNKWDKISDGSGFRNTIEEFEEIRSQSVDFFKDITNPEQIRSQLARLEREGVTPDQNREVQINRFKVIDAQKVEAVKQQAAEAAKQQAAEAAKQQAAEAAKQQAAEAAKQQAAEAAKQQAAEAAKQQAAEAARQQAAEAAKQQAAEAAKQQAAEAAKQQAAEAAKQQAAEAAKQQAAEAAKQQAAITVHLKEATFGVKNQENKVDVIPKTSYANDGK